MNLIPFSVGIHGRYGNKNVENGIGADRMESKGCQESGPVADCSAAIVPKSSTKKTYTLNLKY